MKISTYMYTVLHSIPNKIITQAYLVSQGLTKVLPHEGSWRGICREWLSLQQLQQWPPHQEHQPLTETGYAAVYHYQYQSRLQEMSAEED